jgi:autotransporter-associated beta strand protein
MNAINLAGAVQTVEVNDNTATSGDFATISGVLSNGGLMKDGNGTLVLTGANSYSNATTVKAGALRAKDGIGLPAASNLIFSGGVFESMGAATFVRSLGTSGSNTVQWKGSGGFSANGSKMTVAIGGTASPTPLVWGSGNFDSSYLTFGSGTADSETEFENNIDLAGAACLIKVTDNPFSTGDFATISGTLSNGSLHKYGAGLLVLNGSHTYVGKTWIEEGTLRLASGATLASTSFCVLAGATFDVRDLDIGFTLPPGAALEGEGAVLGTLVTGGTVATWVSPGILTVEDITFTSTGVLRICLGGLARGTEYDVLAASGTVTMQSGSTLAVTLINGFVPQGGDEFDILDFAGVSGAFSAPNLPALGDGLSWDTSDLYTSGTILVAPEPASAAVFIAGLACTLLRRRAK